jgi:hypothetical protein
VKPEVDPSRCTDRKTSISSAETGLSDDRKEREQAQGKQRTCARSRCGSGGFALSGTARPQQRSAEQLTVGIAHRVRILSNLSDDFTAKTHRQDAESVENFKNMHGEA